MVLYCAMILAKYLIKDNFNQFLHYFVIACILHELEKKQRNIS